MGSKEVMDDTDDMIFEIMEGMLSSPAWDLAVMSFMDEHCEAFTNDEENKLVYTEIHANFTTIVETLIDEEMGKAGLTKDDLLAACVRARDKSEVTKSVYGQLVAMDNFMIFKKMMVRRNAELTMEAMQEMDTEPIIAPATALQAEQDFQRAAKEVADMSHAEAASIVDRAADGATTYNKNASSSSSSEAKMADASEFATSSAVVAEPGKEAAMDAELKRQVDANLRQMEILHQEEEIEQLELEEAIAQSLAMEQARLSEEIEQIEMQKTIAASIAETKDEAKDEVLTAKAAEAPVAAQAKDLYAPRDASPPPEDKSRKPPANGLAPLAPLGGLKPVSKLPALGPLPSINDLQEQMRAKRQAAEEAFRRNQELLKEQNRHKAEIHEQAGVTADDVERRRRELKKQRDRIVAKKKKARKERAAKLAAEDGAQPKEAEDIIAAKEQRASKPAPTEENDEHAEQRAMMARALGRRLKQDLVIENQHDRLRSIEQQTSELDEKLRTVLQLRMQNREKEQELQEAINRHQAQRFQNVKLSVARNVANHDDF